MNNDPDYKTINHYDRIIGNLHGLPDVLHTKSSTVTTVTPITGEAVTFIVETYRQRDIGDTIALQSVSAEGSLRLVIPPRVADAIARQRDALTDRSRSKAARAVALERRERGEVPGFMRKASLTS